MTDAVATGQYDIAVACNTFSLNHFDSKRGVDALCRLVRAGGYVIIVMRAYATSDKELDYFKEALGRMSELERNGEWRRVWCSTALDIYDLSATHKQSSSSQSGTARRASNFSGNPTHNDLLRPAKLLVYCKALQQATSTRRGARRPGPSAMGTAVVATKSQTVNIESLTEQIEPIALK